MMLYTLSLGSNLGNKKEYLEKSINLISKKIGNVISQSKIYKTEPWGFETKNYFLNMAIVVESTLMPNLFLKKILGIEKLLGRERGNGDNYLSRTIDIDIIFLEDSIINDKDLIIPHPLLGERMFVLKPLNDIIPEFIHPIKKHPIKKMLKNCGDKSEIYIFA